MGKGGRSIKEIVRIITESYLLILGHTAKLRVPQGSFRKGGIRERQTCICQCLFLGTEC